MPWSQKLMWVVVGLILLGGAGATLMSLSHKGLDEGPGRVWSEEHQHWH